MELWGREGDNPRKAGRTGVRIEAKGKDRDEERDEYYTWRYVLNWMLLNGIAGLNSVEI